MSEPIAPPDGFLVGHWTDAVGITGCTAVIAPPGSRAGVDVRGGGPGTRETDVIGPLAGTAEVTAVMLTGGSAYGLAAADGAMRWCEENGRGYATPGGLVPIVPAAVIYDLASGDPRARPRAEDGYAACAAALGAVPETGRVGAGTGAGVGKILGRERGAPGGLGYAAGHTGTGITVAVIAVVNAFGDVIADDGEVLAGPAGEAGERLRTAELIAAMETAPEWPRLEERNTTLVCAMTDAAARQAGLHPRRADGKRRSRPCGRPGLLRRRRRRCLLRRLGLAGDERPLRLARRWQLGRDADCGGNPRRGR